jgi:hypothetical protein
MQALDIGSDDVTTHILEKSSLVKKILDISREGG